MRSTCSLLIRRAAALGCTHSSRPTQSPASKLDLEPCTFKPHCCPNPPERNIAHGIEDALAEGRLVRILEGRERSPLTLSVLYRSRHHVPAKTRLFIDYMVEQLG